MKKVVITGMSGITALGNDADSIFSKLLKGKTATQRMPWDHIDGLNTRLAAPINDFEFPKASRKKTRSMGKVSKLATLATSQALSDANLLNQQDILSNGKTGIAYGSCSGSPEPLSELLSILTEEKIGNVNATTYIKGMSHTCAVNLALFFGITGRLIPTSSACTSSSQAIGYAYENIKYGMQDIVIAGGAEELCLSQVAIFDTFFATSQKNDNPEHVPRPFDKDRDGLVIGEGATTLILESLEHAQNRGAKIYAEVVGYGTNCDAEHVTQPTADKIQIALELALKDAKIKAGEVDYVNAHGTSTELGDIAESIATSKVFNKDMNISSLKGYFGHTLGACGALEAWLSIEMMNRGLIIPNVNLLEVDNRCAKLNYLKKPKKTDLNYIMSNNFAFGGVNTSLIFKKF
ncbi:beta-ketoacyl-ACP synthase II [Francisella halioticida]|uniref:Beta-ketoacyl-ACP synthase II n=1 Tax=Francisella halioticida TaxID=549298 RepID=A0ABN5AYD5_9GAMM|nr:beta-ketoacyl-ACP synthase [Francisella halioticida]ASG68881.1 beta-ketoacyl-ACP synthase II [Francisella halioticida]